MSYRKDLVEYCTTEIQEETDTIESIYYLKEDVDNILNDLESKLNDIETVISQLTTDLY